MLFRSLQRQNDQLRAQLAQAQTGDADSKQLASLLRLSAGKYKVVTGSVIAAGGDYSDTVTIDVGGDNGITANETVLNGDGLVGTVVTATATTATVQLLTDAGATVGVKMAGTGQIGSLTGSAGTMTGTAPLRTARTGTARTRPVSRPPDWPWPACAARAGPRAGWWRSASRS